MATYDRNLVVHFKTRRSVRLHRKGMLPTTGIYGISPIEEALPEATLLYQINEYERTMMAITAVRILPSGYKQGSLEPERRRALGKMWRQMFQGPGG